MTRAEVKKGMTLWYRDDRSRPPLRVTVVDFALIWGTRWEAIVKPNPGQWCSNSFCTGLWSCFTAEEPIP